MDRSPGFGSAPADFPPYSDLVSLRLRAFQPLTSPASATRRTVLQKVRGPSFYRGSTACKHRVSGSLSLPSRGSFHLSLTVLFAIGHQVVFSLGGWSHLLPTGFHVSGGTLVPTVLTCFSLTRLLLSSAGISIPILLNSSDHVRRPATPKIRRLSVWALPRSLAATRRIDLSFFSSGYLDVSVHRVPSV